MVESMEYGDSFSASDEMLRLLSDRYLNAIHEQNIDCERDVDSEGSYILHAPVKGTEGLSAIFTISIDEFENLIQIHAIYSSDVLESPETANLEVSETEDPKVVADFVADFIWNCFYKEHMQYCAFEHITSKNIERYIQFLPEFFFDDDSKEYYAAGICLAELDSVIPAGAAVYSSENGYLVVDYVMIDEDLRGLGLGTYLVNNLFSTFDDLRKKQEK